MSEKWKVSLQKFVITDVRDLKESAQFICEARTPELAAQIVQDHNREGWIPCSARMPRCNEIVLVGIVGDELVSFGWLENGKLTRAGCGESPDITHWMPRPTPPKDCQ
jgi:hypothetical protein